MGLRLVFKCPWIFKKRKKKKEKKKKKKIALKLVYLLIQLFIKMSQNVIKKTHNKLHKLS